MTALAAACEFMKLAGVPRWKWPIIAFRFWWEFRGEWKRMKPQQPAAVIDLDDAR